MFVLKFEYETATGVIARTLFFQELSGAREIFGPLQRGILLDEPVKFRGGKVVDVISARIYRTNSNNPVQVDDGSATLIAEAKPLEIELG